MNYDGLFILNIQGKDEGLKEIIDLIEKEIGAMDGKVAGVQKMDKRKFERNSGDLDAGYYVNVQFSLDPQKVEPLRQKLDLNSIIYRQFYLKQEKSAETASTKPTKTKAHA